MEDEDYLIEDIFSNLNKKKKVKSGKKGNRGENGLCKILTERFKKPFSRVVGSGARTSQVNLSEEAKLILTGDISVPRNFKFSIESKHGYSSIDFCNVLENGNKTIEDFMEQVSKDARSINRKPLLCWKKDRMAWVAFLKKNDLPNYKDYAYHFCYNDWVAISLKQLLTKEDDFFLEKI